MQIWIITESSELTTSLRNSLRALGIDCPAERTLGVQAAGKWALQTPESACVCFLAVTTIRATHLSLLQHLRGRGNVKVVVVSAAADSEATLHVFRAGASDLLSWQTDLSAQLAKLMQRLRAEHSAPGPTGKLITVVPSGSRCDGNLLAVNVAATLANATADCGLIDLHLRGGDLATMLKLEPPHTMFALLTQKDGVDETMIEQTLACHATGIRLLASPKLFSRLDNIQTSCCQPIFHYMKASRSCTVVNTDDAVHAGQLQALVSSDAVLVTTRLDIVSLARAKETLRFLCANHLARNELQVIAMRTGHAGELPVKSVCKLLDIPSLVCIPDDPVAITASLNIGNPLVQEYPRSAFTAAVLGLVETMPALQGFLPSGRTETWRLLDQSLKFFGESLWPRRKTERLQPVSA